MKGLRTVSLKAFIIAVLVMLSLISISQAQESEKIEKVITTGLGTDFEKAKQNAVRNAIEQVIGTYVSSDTIVKNSTLINDNILTYSGGYVKEAKVLSQKKDNDGLFSVQIETSVVATQLKRKLESLNIATKTIEGGGLFSEASSKVDEQRSATELLKKILSKYPQAAYAIEVGKPDIVSVDPSTNMANVNIPLIFRWDKSFLAELGDVLSRVAREKLELTPYDLGMGMTPIARAYYGAKEHNGILCMAQRGVVKSGKADTCWVFRRPFGQGEGDNLLNLPVVSGNMTLSISFKDRENKTVEVISYALQQGDNDTWMGQRIAFGRNDIHFSLQLDLGTFHPPNVLWSSDHDSYNSPATRHVLLISDGVFNLAVKAQIRVENLKNISSMEVHFDPWKN